MNELSSTPESNPLGSDFSDNDPATNEKQNASAEFPIVGIGASAGGLEAFESFFTNMPDDVGMAFVIIQHLAPGRDSMMASLLAKFTAMPIREIRDGMPVKPDCVFLNPPGSNVIIENGKLHLTKPMKEHGLNLSIDVFFRSLAVEREQTAIGVILSGTGTDGTLGLEAIKAAGGLTLVQNELQAKFGGMPHSAIDTGLIDVILPVEKIPGELQKYVRHPYLTGVKQPEKAEPEFKAGLKKIFALLRAEIGHDFSGYKTTTLRRRIERRMVVHQFEHLTVYVQYLQDNPEELYKLFKDFLIGVTGFFRDPDTFEVLKESLLPCLKEKTPRESPIRVWVPGCSTGEEAFSIAIILFEIMTALKRHREIQIYASDLDSAAIETARAGLYPKNIQNDISEERLRRFFTKEGEGYKVKKRVREAVVFAEQNLVKDPPFSKLDLVSCRNLLIYLKPELQRKVLPLVHYTLNPQGLLFLGTSESIGEFTDLFSVVDQKAKIFQKKEPLPDEIREYPLLPVFDTYPPASDSDEKSAPPKEGIRRLTEKIILDDYASPCVIVSQDYKIHYLMGQTDKYLKPPAGDPIFNILTMARRGLAAKLKIAIQTAFRQKQIVEVKNLWVEHNGKTHPVDVLVRPLPESGRPSNLMMVIFTARPEVPIKKPAQANTGEAGSEEPTIVSLERELQITRESLQSTIEELETAYEEQKSTNEELQATNEELQSSNEELKTSREELQSTNEELTTVNVELQHKVDELSRVNSDINNLLGSTEIATIFLDTDLHIKRFTPSIKKIFNIILSDIDRPISDITSNLKYENLEADAVTVLDTLMRKEFEIQDKHGNWYTVRLIPYRTTENIIDGVVVTFVDISRLKVALEAQAYAESIVDTVRQPLLILDETLKVHSANKSFYRTFQLTPADTENHSVYALGNGQWDIAPLKLLLERIIPRNNQFDDYELVHEFPGLGPKRMMLNARRISAKDNHPAFILLAIEDVTAKDGQ